jgi:hypothetical protein
MLRIAVLVLLGGASCPHALTLQHQAALRPPRSLATRPLALFMSAKKKKGKKQKKATPAAASLPPPPPPPPPADVPVIEAPAPTFQPQFDTQPLADPYMQPPEAASTPAVAGGDSSATRRAARRAARKASAGSAAPAAAAAPPPMDSFAPPMDSFAAADELSVADARNTDGFIEDSSMLPLPSFDDFAQRERTKDAEERAERRAQRAMSEPGEPMSKPEQARERLLELLTFDTIDDRPQNEEPYGFTARLIGRGLPNKAGVYLLPYLQTGHMLLLASILLSSIISCAELLPPPYLGPVGTGAAQRRARAPHSHWQVSWIPADGDARRVPQAALRGAGDHLPGQHGRRPLCPRHRRRQGGARRLLDG